MRRWTARLALAAYVAGCAIWLLHLDYARKISTNVLDLIPSGESAPELGAVRDLAENVQARVVLFTLRDLRPGAPAPAAAARALAAALASSPPFAEAEALEGDGDEEKFGRALYADRNLLLLPTWLGAQERDFGRTGLPAGRYAGWTARRAAARLEDYLSAPEAMSLEQLLPADPLLLLAPLAAQARMLGAARAPAADVARVWTRIRASPLSEAGQGPVQAAIDRARERIQARFPAVQVRWTGVNRFAAASRARIEREIKLLNTASLAAVLLVGCAFVRRVWKLAHLVPVVLCSLLGAWTVSTLVFPRLHILVFVIGSLLSGVAVDYGFYIFMQPYASAAEGYGGKLRRLLKPLLASCLTTVAGFSLLLFSDLPLIRQVGVFVSSGLLAALGAAMLYFAQVQRPLLEPRAWAAGGRTTPAGRPVRAAALALAAIALAVALFAPWLLRWNDDIRELDVAQPALQANDEAVRRAFGDDRGGATYLTYGDTLPAARRHLAEFLAYLARAAPGAEPFSLGLVLPTAADYADAPGRLRALREFPAAFRVALAERGFRADAFAPFFNGWDRAARARDRPSYAQLCDRLEASLAGPLRLLVSPGAGAGSRAWFVTLADGPLARPPPALQTVDASELQHLNRLFSQYRWSALRLSLIGLGLVVASVFAIYPPGRAVRIALIPSGSCFFVFGVMGLCGQTLNLFHLLGAFLGVCLAHNYSIFSSDSSAAGRTPPAPVRLSGLCASASFGVLAFSHIPVVHTLGLTVALIVLTALAAVEIEARCRSLPA